MSSRLFGTDSASPGPGAVAAPFLNLLANWSEETQISMMEREVLRGSIHVPSFRGCRITVTVLITWTTSLLTSWWLLAWWRNSPLFKEDKKLCTVFFWSCHQTLSSASYSQSCLTAYHCKIDCYTIILCLRNFLFPSIFQLKWNFSLASPCCLSS
jgi:hypothetical protein